MNWICLYAVESNTRRWLFYGYATFAADLPSGLWFESTLTCGTGWRLLRYSRAAGDQDLDALQSSFSSQPTTTLTLRSDGNPQVEICHGPLGSRPVVYSIPRGFAPSGTPVSLSEQLGHVEALWQMAPEELLDATLPAASFSVEARQESLLLILEAIEKDTGIDLLGVDAARLGNFEVVRYIAGCYDVPDGLHSRPDVGRTTPGGSSSPPSLVVWVEPPLADLGALQIGCRLFNGHSNKLRTLILNEIRPWPAADGNPLHFTPQEPFSSYDIFVWNQDGQLVAHQEESVLRRIDVEMQIRDPSRASKTGWDENLPPHLRSLVAKATAWLARNLSSGDYLEDPWVPVAEQKRALLRGLAPRMGESEFFEASIDEHVRAVLFLTRLLRRRGVRRVVLADPYLDEIGVESLLVRIPDVSELVVLASHRRPVPKSVLGWWERLCQAASSSARRFAVVARRIFGRPGSPQRRNPVSALVDGCEKHCDKLPAKVTILNVENVNGEGQQFHDRCLVVETEGGTEAWVLTNSLSMVARRFPLVITRLDESAARRVANYLGSLERADVPGRPDLRTVVLWSKPKRSEAVKAKQASPPDSSQSKTEWQAAVLGILVPERSCDRLRTALDRGLLEREARLAETTWRVPSETLSTVKNSVRNHLKQYRAEVPDVLCALARWSYNGGPDPNDYDFDPSIADSAITALEQIIAPGPANAAGAGIDLASEIGMPESVDDVRMYLAHNAPADFLSGSAAEVDFLARLLWPLAPARLVKLLDQTRSSDLFGWLAAHCHSLSPDQRQGLLQSDLGRVQALGVAILWDRDLGALASFPLKQRLVEIATELNMAGAPPLDAFLCILLLTTTKARTEIDLAAAATFAMQQHPVPLGEAGRARLIALLKKPHPLHTVVRVSGCAEKFPASDASELDQWCFNELLRHLPRRGWPAPSRDRLTPRCGEPTVSNAVARSVWRLFEDSAPQEVVKQVVTALDYHGANAPLYPTRDFAAWNAHLDSLLWGLQFALRFVAAAPTSWQERALQAVLPVAVDGFGKLRPGLWHRYLDQHGLLGEVLDAVARWMDDDGATQQAVDEFTKLLSNRDIPGILRLRAYLGSTTLARANQASLGALATNPGSAPSMCVRMRGAQAQESLRGHIVRLRKEAPDLSSILDQVEASLEVWLDARYPPST